MFVFSCRITKRTNGPTPFLKNGKGGNMGIDEISMSLGRLESGQDNLNRWVAELARKQEEMRCEITSLKDGIARTEKAVVELTVEGCAHGQEDRAEVAEVKKDFKALVMWLIGGNIAGVGAIEGLKAIFGK
jgi:hypothetical protein